MRSLLPNSRDLHLFLTLMLLGACGGGEGIILPGDGEAAAITVTAGDGQEGRVGEPLINPLVVQVTDSRGRPVEGAAVAFQLTSAGSVVVPPQKSTNADGKADAQLVLGTTFGRQTGNARVVTQGGRPAIQTDFSAMALPVDANTMAVAGGQDQSGHVGSQLDERLVVRVTDRFENPVEGVPITWVAEGGGSVSAEVVQTDEDGESGVRRTLGPTVGQQTTVARSEGLAGSPVTFVHTALAGDASRLVIVSGNNQTALAGSALPADLVVRLLDADGNGIPATAVSWVVATGEGRANPENSITDDGGRTSAKWTLGNAVGEQRLDAVVSGVGVASFRATATSPVLATNTTITADSPDPSVANSEFPVEFRVTSSGPTPTGTVSVTVSGGPATCTATLSGGVGSCTLRLGGLGDRTITATYSGAPGFSGSSDTESHRVVPAPPENEAPSADFNWHCEDLTCFFTDASDDDDGTITGRSWNFGDGAVVADQLNPSHTYALGGDYTVILTVTDNGGLTDDAQDVVDPQAPPPQVLEIGRQPSSSAELGEPFGRQPQIRLRAGGRDIQRAGVVVTASIATGSGTLGGTTTAATDGNGRAEFNNLSISGASGLHTLRFTAPGFAEVISNSIEVQKAVSQTVISSPDMAVVGTGVRVDFSVTGGGGPPTGNVTVAAQDGPGESCTGSVADGFCMLTFTAPGDRNIRATYAGDERFEGSSDGKDIEVAEPENVAPTAAFNAPTCTVNVACDFSATGSSDPDGQIASWDWSFSEGDPQSGETVSHVYITTGGHSATLTVTDNDGASSIPLSQTITVNP